MSDSLQPHESQHARPPAVPFETGVLSLHLQLAKAGTFKNKSCTQTCWHLTLHCPRAAAKIHIFPLEQALHLALSETWTL